MRQECLLAHGNELQSIQTPYSIVNTNQLTIGDKYRNMRLLLYLSALRIRQ
jgi:hypothetical protein